MIITCEQCQARFRLADEKLKPGGTKVRCSKCKSVFTVLPPESAPAEESVDFGDFNMERVDEETPSAPSPPAPEPAEAPAGAEMDLDFSGLEQSIGPGTGHVEGEDDFSFADTTTPVEPPAVAAEEAFSAATAIDDDRPDTEGSGGELDFDATFAETETEPASTESGDGEAFAFDSAFAEPDQETSPAAAESFGFESAAAAAGEFDFSTEPVTAEAGEFSFDGQPAVPSFAIDETPEDSAGTGEFDLGSGDEGGTSFGFEDEPGLTEEPGAWDQPAKEESSSFNFDEPSFETTVDQPAPKSGGDSSLGFGEIDFSNDGDEPPPGFGGEPDFSQATFAKPAEPELPAVEQPVPPRPAPSRPRSEEPLAPPPPRKSAVSKVLVVLVLLFLGLCGAGGYFYFMGDGQQVVDRLLLKLKGEEPPVAQEQRIGLNIAGSSYVENREAGQLLVIQGSATNNFAGARSAITVKGLLLDAGGKVLQQQTVFCGNYLSEEKLRTLRYAQIEEAMNNQFGDSLSNMNLKSGATIRFTIVFRNLPNDLANINVEVVDSKAGGL